MTVLETQIELKPRVGGEGRLAFGLVNGRTVVTCAHATSPLRLVTPMNAGDAAWVYTSTFGGGLLAGDEITLSIEAAAGTAAYVSSQSSTKIFRSEDGRASRQVVSAKLSDGSLLVYTPDPVVCFADARYAQTQRFDVAASSGLVMLDWYTSGRHACGERWELAGLRAMNEIFVEGKRVLRDVLLLDPEAGPLGGPFRMGGFNCFATLIIMGKRVEAHAQGLLRKIAGMPIRRNDPMPVAASPLLDGVILRLAAPGVEEASHFLFEQLGFLTELLGEHPWNRKW